MPSSSLLMKAGPLVLSLIASATALTQRTQQYQLLESWQGESFIENWNFYGGSDPTNGYVTYVNQSFAQSSGLVKVTDSGSLYMGVDYQTTLSPSGPGRDSVRIETQNYYSEGLWLVDLEHMPGSVCGTWPAFWSVGPNWPNDGEIDIIEGVNLADANEIVLHTSDTCDISSSNEMDGKLTSAVCGESSGTTGCVVEGKSGSFGTPFNQQGGGVYALEWTDSFIKIWFFPRDSIPTSITNGSPDTSSFGTPMANMQGSCDFSERFTNQKLIFDTTFCGDWAGGVFETSGCPMSDSSSAIQSCVNYVAANPAVFQESYWEINSVKIYQLGSSASSSVVHSPSATSSVESLASSDTSSVESSASSVISSVTTLASEPTVAGFTTTLGIESSEQTTFITPQPTTSATSAAESTVPVQTPIASSSSDDDQSEEESDVTSTSTSTSTLYVTSRTTICPLTESLSAVPTGNTPVETGTAQPASTPTSATSVGVPPAAANSVPALGDSAVQNTVPVGSALPVIQTYSSSAKLFASSRFVSSVTGVASSGSGAAITTGSPSTATNSASNSASSTIPAGATFTAAASKLSAGVSGLAGLLIIAMLA